MVVFTWVLFQNGQAGSVFNGPVHVDEGLLALLP